MKPFVSKRPSLVAVEAATATKKPAPKATTDPKKLTLDILTVTHAAMKRSCQRRGVSMLFEVTQVLRAFYQGGPAVLPAPLDDEDVAATIMAKIAKPKVKARVTFEIPPELHAAIADQAAARHKKITDEIQELLTAQYHKPV